MKKTHEVVILMLICKHTHLDILSYSVGDKKMV